MGWHAGLSGFIFIYNFICLFGCSVSSLMCTGFLWLQPVGLSGSQFLAAVRGLLIAVASLVEHRLQGTQTSVVVAHRLGCSVACGIFLDQGLNPCLLHWQVYFSPLSYQGSPGMRWFLAGVGNWAVVCIEGGLTVASLHPREASRTPCMRPMSADTLCAPASLLRGVALAPPGGVDASPPYAGVSPCAGWRPVSSALPLVRTWPRLSPPASRWLAWTWNGSAWTMMGRRCCVKPWSVWSAACKCSGEWMLFPRWWVTPEGGGTTVGLCSLGTIDIWAGDFLLGVAVLCITGCWSSVSGLDPLFPFPGAPPLRHDDQKYKL